jgi:carnitine 3-dehydrogenase
MANGKRVGRICVVGAGVIGAGWAARCLARGLEVVATDPARGGEEALRASVANAWPALEQIGLAAGASRDRLRFTNDLEQALEGADFVQENAPEDESLKRRLIARIDAAAPPDVLIASSSSGLLPTRLQADCAHPERVLIGHPFNPVYILPLVELVPGERTAPAAIERAHGFYRSLGMRPLKVRKEIAGYVSDRLQEAIWREALHIIKDGVATTAEVDASISDGPGMRLALMGPCLTFHLAGGEGGMQHFFDHFGVDQPWTHCPPPELTPELVRRMVDGTAAQQAGRSVKELEQYRDKFLIRLLALKREIDPSY